MANAITVCLVIVGLINFTPLLGVVSSSKLERSYSIELQSNDLIILMRHRALLFGVLGGFILYAALVPYYQNAAMLMAGISMLGYGALTLSVGGYNAALFKVLLVDIVGLLLLLCAVILKFWFKASP